MALVGNISGSGGISNTIGITGSLIIANPGLATFPGFPGTDTVFFVSGAIDGKSVGSRTVSVFGGDVVASGSITVGTGSVTITSNEIRFLGGVAKIISGSGGLTFFDSGTPSGVTLATLTAGSAGGDVDGPATATDNAIARFDQTTGKIIQDSAVTISDESAGAVTIAGSATATTVNLFNTIATTVSAFGAATALTIGDSTTATTTVRGGTIVGNAATQNVFNTTATTVNAFGVATALTIGATTGGTTVRNNLTVTGDLTVNGTTVTVDATTLTIEDPVIGLGFTSGSIAVAAGDRGFIGGINAADNVALFWDNTDSTFTSVRTSTGAGNDPVAITSYTPFRASSFQVGGTPGSAVAAGSAFLSSSDALNVLVNHTATTTFTKSGTPTVQIGTYDTSNEGLIKGVTTGGALSDLWLSGTAVKIGSTMTSFIGADDQRRGTISGSAGGQGLILTAQDGTFTPRTLTLSGSGLELGAASQGMSLKFAGAERGSFTATGNSLTLGTPSTVSLTLSGANGVSIVHGGLGTGFIKDFGGAAYLTIEADINDARLKAPGDIILRADGADIKFSSGSSPTQLTLSLAGNNASFKGAANQQVNIGSDGAGGGMTVSGSSVTVNVGTGGLVFQRDGVAELHVNVLSTLTTISGSAAQSVTLAAGTGATTLTLSGSTVEHKATIAHKFNLDATMVAHVTESNTRKGIFPGQDSQFDLGGPTLRWANMYTGDLHLRNERGDWTVIEEEDFLTLTNNKSGKRYKFVLEEI